MGKNPSPEIAWQIRHCISTATLSREELTLRGEGLTVHVSPSVHLGGKQQESSREFPRRCVTSQRGICFDGIFEYE